MTKLFPVAIVAATLTGIVSAQAQNYPSRPITIVVPFAAGGPTDVIARVVGERMRATLGQNVIIENVTGAAGSIAVGRVARSAADGYTIVIGHWGTHVVNGATYSLQYDLLNDLAPVALLASTPSLIVSKSAVPAKDLKELIAWLKANPGKAAQGSGGAGSAAHIHGIFFQQRTDTHFQHVPYRGAAPAMQDLIGGQIDLMIDQVPNSLPHARSGKIRAYAVTAKTASRRRPTFRPSMKQGCRISIRRSGTRFGLHGLHRATSSARSTLLWSKLSLIQRFGIVWWPTSAKPSRSVPSRRPKRLAPFTRPRSRSGGRSSRLQTSKETEQVTT